MNIFKYVKKFLFFILKEVFSSLIFLSIVALLIGFISFTFLKKEEKLPLINSNSYLKLSLPNGLNEINDFQLDLFNKNNNLTMFQLLKTIEYSSYDEKIGGIILDLDNLNLSFPQMEELGKELKEFKKTGKKIIAFGYGLNKNNFLLGSLANRIYMEPAASTEFSLEGFKLSIPYSKKLTDKIGVEFQVVHIGDYKTYGENYVKNSITTEFKSSYEKILESRMNYFTENLANNRKINVKAFKNDFLNGKFLLLNSKKALKNKLIDKQLSYDDALEEEKIKDEVELNEYSKTIKTPEKDNKIAVIVAEGDISTYSEFNKGITPANMKEQIEKAMKNDNIKAVVLRVNSPGGSALASEIIYQKLLELKKKKPLYVSISDTAASGGYYISSAGKKIFANKNSITGSIGVVTMSFNVKKLYEKLGLNYETLELGTNLDFYDLTKKPSSEELKLIRESMTDVYEEFKSRVSVGRKLTMENVETLAKGQIYTGLEAKNNKLIDEIGGLSDTIGAISKDYKINNYEVIFFEKDFDKLEQLLDLKKYLKMPTLLEKLQTIDETIHFINEINNKPSLYLPLKKEL